MTAPPLFPPRMEGDDTDTNLTKGDEFREEGNEYDLRVTLLKPAK
jgi:hypothetical protein